jgi:hypothetical protein
MGRYRGGQKSWEQADNAGRKLDSRQFPELNAVFYTARPAEFISMRIMALSLLACDDAQLEPAFGADRVIGNVTFPAAPVPDEKERRRYIQTEAMMIVHHASEALLRLFFAHVDHPECPWLGMADERGANQFKDRLGEAMKAGFDTEEIARIFLGGESPTDSELDMTAEEFDAAVEGVDRLLWDCALRVTDDSFLYNGGKHGLTSIEVADENARFAWKQGTKQLTLHMGAVHAYLHKLRSPMSKKNERTWFFSMMDSNPQRDLAVARFAASAIGSLWSVARRQYLGTPGSILCFSKESVELAIHSPVTESRNVMKRFGMELPKLKPDGEVDGTEIDVEAYNVPEEWEPSEDGDTKSRRVILPVRQRDKKIYSTSSKAYLPIVPKGFQQG